MSSSSSTTKKTTKNNGKKGSVVPAAPPPSIGEAKQGAEVEEDLSHVPTGADFINANLPSFKSLGSAHWNNPQDYFDFNGGLGHQMGCTNPGYYCFVPRGGGGGGRGGGGYRGGGGGGGFRGGGGRQHHVDVASGTGEESSGDPAAPPKPQDTLPPLNPLTDCSMPSAPRAISGLYMLKAIEALSSPACNYHERFELERDRDLLCKELLKGWGKLSKGDSASFYDLVQRAISDEWEKLMPAPAKRGGGGRGGRGGSNNNASKSSSPTGAATALVASIRQALTTIVLFHRFSIGMPYALLDATQENTLQKKGTKDPKELFFALRDDVPSPAVGGRPDVTSPATIDEVLKLGASYLGNLSSSAAPPASGKEGSVKVQKGIDIFAKVQKVIHRQRVQDAEEILASDNHGAKGRANDVLREERVRTWAPHVGIMETQVVRTKHHIEEENGNAEEEEVNEDNQSEEDDHTNHSEESEEVPHIRDLPRHKKAHKGPLRKEDLECMTTSFLAQAAWFKDQPPRIGTNKMPRSIDIHAKSRRLHTTYIAPTLPADAKGNVPLPFEDNKKTKSNPFRRIALEGATLLRKINDVGAARSELTRRIDETHTRSDLATPIHDQVVSSGAEEFSKKIYQFDVALGAVHTKSGSEHEDTFWVNHLDRLITQVLVPSCESLKKMNLAKAKAWVYRCQTLDMTDAEVASVSAMPGVMDVAALFGVVEEEDGGATAPMTDSVIMTTYGPDSKGSTALCSAMAASKRLEVIDIENQSRNKLKTGTLSRMKPKDRIPAAAAIRANLIRFVEFTHLAENILKLPFLLVVQPSTKFCQGTKDYSDLKWKPIGEFDGLVLRVKVAGTVVHRVLEMKSNLADLAGAAKQRDRLGKNIWTALNRPPVVPAPPQAAAADGAKPTKEGAASAVAAVIPTEVGAGSGVDTPVTLTVGDIMIQLCPVRDQEVPAYLLRVFPLLQASFTDIPTAPFNLAESPTLTPLDAHYRALVRTWVYVSKVVVESTVVHGREVWIPSTVPNRLVGGGSFRHVICSTAAILAARDFHSAFADGSWMDDMSMKPLVSGCTSKIRYISVERTENAFTKKPHCPQAIVEELRTLGCLENLLLIPSAAIDE